MRVTWLDSWLAPVFHDVHQPVPHTFARGGELTAVAFVFAVVGIVIAVALYRHGLAQPRDDPLHDRLGAPRTRRRARLLLRRHHLRSRRRSGPGRREFLDEDVDQRVIDGAVNGTGRLVRRRPRVSAALQDGFVRRYAIGIALGAAAILLFLIAYAGALTMRRLPDPHRDHRHAAHRRGRRALLPQRPPRDHPGGRLRVHRRDPRA